MLLYLLTLMIDFVCEDTMLNGILNRGIQAYKQRLTRLTRPSS